MQEKFWGFFKQKANDLFLHALDKTQYCKMAFFPFMHLLSCFSPAAPKGNSDRISSISYSNSGSVWQLPATSQWCAKQNFEKRLQLREVKISLKIKDLKSICLNLRTDANLSMESTE